MQTRTYFFYSTNSQNAAVSRTIVAPGYIHAVCWAIGFNAVADNDQVVAELSFQNSIGANTDNALGIVDVVAAYSNLVTSGLAQPVLSVRTLGIYIPVGVGQILYLNTSHTGAAFYRCLLHVIEK